MNQQMDNQLPEGWVEASLGELNQYQASTVQPEKFAKTTFELYSVPAFPEKIPEILQGESIGSSKQLVLSKDVLICKINPRINRVWVVKDIKQYQQIASSEWIVFRQPALNERYFGYYFQSLRFRNLLCADVTGVGGSLTRAQPKKVATFELPLPPLAEQHYLADKLDSLLARIQTVSDQLAAVPALLKQFRQSVLADAVSGKLTAEWRNKNELSISNYQEISQQEKQDKLDKRKIKTASLPHEFAPSITLPESWRWLSLDEACYKITDGTHHSPKSYATGDFMYVTSKNVREGYLDLSNITYVDKATHQEIFSRCNVAYQDVLYIKDGVNTGLSCVNTIEEEISLLSSVAVFKPCSFLHPFYLQHYLNSPVGRQVMLDLMGGTAIKRLTLQKIINSPIPIPPLTEQTEIVRRVEALFALADQIEQQSRAAAERVALLTQSVLAKAFRGELSEQWRCEHPDLISGDNSAAALLARIQAERAATGKKSRRA